MEVVGLSEATTQLAALVERAAKGEDIAISLDGVPVARLIRLAARKRPLKFGLLQGRLVVPEDFDQPLPADVLMGFEGRPSPR